MKALRIFPRMEELAHCVLAEKRLRQSDGLPQLIFFSGKCGSCFPLQNIAWKIGMKKENKNRLEEQDMKRMKRLILQLLVLFLTVGVVGCGNTAKNEMGAENAPEPERTEPVSMISITDMKGREITLDKPVERIVALTASDCEILYAIGAGDALVGRGKFCDYPAEVLDVPAVESGAETNLEEIIALQPDVLLMGDMAQTEEQVAQLEAAGIQVVVSDDTDIEGVYTAVEMIGKLMGKDENAAAVIDDMKTTFENLQAKAVGKETKTVYFEVSPLQYGLWTTGSNTFMDEVATMLGLTNCFADIDGWGQVSAEQVLERNPDYIVTATMYFGEGPTPEEEILSRNGWETVTAVKNRAVLNLQNNELSRPTPRLAEGAQMLFDFVYGDASSE